MALFEFKKTHKKKIRFSILNFSTEVYNLMDFLVVMH